MHLQLLSWAARGGGRALGGAQGEASAVPGNGGGRKPWLFLETCQEVFLGICEEALRA